MASLTLTTGDLTLEEATLPEPQQMVYKDKAFPLVLQAASEPSVDDVHAWVTEHATTVKDELLRDHGAVLLRGFKTVLGAEAFNDVLTSFGFEYVDYVGGGGPRSNIVGHVFNSTFTPPEFVIPFHHELSYLTTFPSKLAFYCDTAPAADGETPILLSNECLEKARAANPEFIARCREKLIRYVRRMADRDTQTSEDRDFQKSWQEIYDTDDQGLAEERARDTGADTIEWTEAGTMIVTSLAVDPVVEEPRTGVETWFNSVCLLHPAAHGKQGSKAPWTVTYGDHSPIADEDILSVVAVMKDSGVYFQWEETDILLVDNTLAFHARNSFTPPRLILASLIHR